MLTEYDFDGRNQVTDAYDNSTAYDYTENGWKTVEQDAEVNTTTWQQNEFGQVVKRTLPLGQFETISYDDRNRRESVTDFNNQSITYSYENIYNRLTAITLPDNSEIAYTYENPLGRIATITDANGTTAYEYFANGRLKKVTNFDGTFISYLYDNNGNIVTRTTPSTVVNYTYDSMNRMQTVTKDGATTQYTYTLTGRIDSCCSPIII